MLAVHQILPRAKINADLGGSVGAAMTFGSRRKSRAVRMKVNALANNYLGMMTRLWFDNINSYDLNRDC